MLSTQAVAEASGRNHPLDAYHLPALGATETSPHYHLLWSHCIRSQIRPARLRRMKQNDLRYIASHSGMVRVWQTDPETGELITNEKGQPVADEGASGKLRANAQRAELELSRRHRNWIALWTSLLAAAAVLAAALLAGAVG